MQCTQLSRARVASAPTRTTRSVSRRTSVTVRAADPALAVGVWGSCWSWVWGRTSRDPQPLGGL